VTFQQNFYMKPNDLGKTVTSCKTKTQKQNVRFSKFRVSKTKTTISIWGTFRRKWGSQWWDVLYKRTQNEL